MRALIGVCLAVAVVGCGGSSGTDAGADSGTTCTPGLSIACAGTGGCAGFQVCNVDGRGFGMCVCPTDAGTDTGPSDLGPPPPCDPVAQTGCPSGQECTWARATGAATVGSATCTAPGTVAELGACHVEAATGTDDCIPGFACNAFGMCGPICDTTMPAPDHYFCGPSEGFFTDATGAPTTVGVGVVRCDPVTGTRADGAPGCGSGLACLGPHGGPYLCVHAGPATNTQGVPPENDASGTPRPDGCAPGFIGMPTSTAPGAPWYCTAYCTPADTTLESHPTPEGVAPHACPTGLECRYDNFLSGAPSTEGNTFGVCFDYTSFGEASCTTYAMTDPLAEAWGCLPRTLPTP